MKRIRFSILAAISMAAMSLMVLITPQAQAQEVYMVNLTAEWCPNCKVLDPRLDQAYARFTDGSVQRVELDFTNSDSMAQAFERVNGTMVAGVYADYAGLTGLAVLVASDSGERIDCINRSMNVAAIEMQIVAAKEIVRTKPIGMREAGSVFCPAPNKRIPQN